MRILWSIPLAIILASCAASGPFAPTRADSESPQGNEAALYEVKTGPGDWGMVQVKVWTEGVEERPAASTGTVAGSRVRLAVEVLNDWNQPVTFSKEGLRLTATRGDKRRQSETVRPDEIPPGVEVPAGDERTFKIGFVVADARPKDLRTFEFRWGLRAGEKSYTRKTMFVRDSDNDRRYYYAPYDPWWYGGYGYSGIRSRGSTGVSIGVGVGYSN